MLKKLFENKMTTDPAQAETAAADAETFEADINFIAISMINRELGLNYNTQAPGRAANTYNFQTGSDIFRDHLTAYERVLRDALSTKQAALQSDAILSAGLPGYDRNWKVLPGVPTPQWLDEYLGFKRERETEHPVETGEPCGNLESFTRR